MWLLLSCLHELSQRCWYVELKQHLGRCRGRRILCGALQQDQGERRGRLTSSASVRPICKSPTLSCSTCWRAHACSMRIRCSFLNTPSSWHMRCVIGWDLFTKYATGDMGGLSSLSMGLNDCSGLQLGWQPTASSSKHVPLHSFLGPHSEAGTHLHGFLTDHIAAIDILAWLVNGVDCTCLLICDASRTLACSYRCILSVWANAGNGHLQTT